MRTTILGRAVLAATVALLALMAAVAPAAWA